jgi:hypothetical protein
MERIRVLDESHHWSRDTPDEWQRRVDGSLIESLNKRERRPLPTPIWASLVSALFFFGSVASAVFALGGNAHWAIPLVLLAGSMYLIRPRYRR